MLLIVSLVAAGGLVTYLLTRDTLNPGGRWSPAWLNGFSTAWTLGPPQDIGEDMRILLEEDHLVRAVSMGTSITISVFDIRDDAPRLLWQDSVEHSDPDPAAAPGETGDALGSVMVWRSRIVVGATLFDLHTGSRTQAPWPATAIVSVDSTQTRAYTCEGASCTQWISPTERGWTTTLPSTGSVGKGIIDPSQTSDGHLLAAVAEDPHADQPSGYAVVQSLDGEATPLTVTGASAPIALADGWLSIDRRRIGAANTVTLYELDGTVSDTFPLFSEPFTTYPWSRAKLTREQATAWLKNGDTSWAPATISVSADDAACQSLTVGDQQLELGADNTLTRQKDGRCVGSDAMKAFEISGQGDIISFHRITDTGRFLILVDVARATIADPIPLGSGWKSHAGAKEVLAVLDESGRITGYRAR
ncbi:hypothetical protein ACSL103130_10325 [Actinomyces slackii]|uniref:Uncharacterized protein n=1 Tax=Actinomyces slackii TaxID=52774 RepID=A0A3S4SEL0_9ACTO|nr:Uncharacterised protein [Actinomyces slackii]